MRKRDRISFWVSVFGFALLAVSFLLMPLDEQLMPQNPRIWNIVTGSWFWISLAAGSTAQIMLWKSWKKNSEKSAGGQRPGVFRFFQNRAAAVADVIWIGSLIGEVVCMFSQDIAEYSSFVFLSLCVFSFSMHCILNGRIYSYMIKKKQFYGKRSVENETF